MTERVRDGSAIAVDGAASSELLQDVRRGFSQSQKELPPKYFYDVRGSELFDEITRLDEYYLTRTERTLLARFAAPWLRESGTAAVVELGAGSADKTRTLLDALPPGAIYVPVDISAEFLHDSAARLRREYPQLRVEPKVADITRLPASVRPASDTVLFAFLGSTIGNFTEPAAVALLASLRERMHAADALLLGADLVKDAAVLEAAYDDARGITAAFNLNVLHVLNRDLGTNFDARSFRHLSYYDAARERIEMHLVSLVPQQVVVPGWRTVHFERGETIRTEVSCKYTRTSLARMLSAAGLRLDRWETDEGGNYALLVARPVPAVRTDRAGARDAVRAPRTRSEAAEWIRSRLVPRPKPRPGIGAEYELLVQHADTHRPAQWAEGGGPLGQWLDAHALRHGWGRSVSGKGAPKYRLAHGGVVTLEPGGQLEYASPVFDSAALLLEDLHACIEPLEDSAREHGLELLACGVDPHNALADVPLQFPSERYRRMSEHFERSGTDGGVMMRQTASLQLNLDVHTDVAATWRLANALTPYLVAMFGNASRHAGGPSGVHSRRATAWRALDPSRTGLFACADDAAVEYARFALRAAAMLRDGRPFGDLLAHGEASVQDWEDHLSTLFPEVRLRGYLELRAIDALPLSAAADAVHLVCTLLWNTDARRAALEVTGAPDAALLVRAGEVGLDDETLRVGAERLGSIARAAGAPLSGATSFARTPLPG